ncbi:MAG: radical SAM protein [Candidatus Omnitrophota bacterium]
MKYYNQISWVDEYVKKVAPYIYVRKADNLLIKIPNEAYKLNEQGLNVLSHLMSGESVYSIIDTYDDKEKVAQDIHNFFCDLRALLKGCYHEQSERRAVEKIPFSLPYNKFPVLSEIAVTYRCNLACRFCYASCGCRKDESSRELSTDQLKQVLTIIKDDAEVPSVSFTGGEPLLRNDLAELIRFAKSRKMWTNLITNATLITAEKAQGLKDAGLDSAQVSLEAGTADLHDLIVQKPGAFVQTLQGLNNLKNAGIRVHTNTTISRLNKDKLTGILDLIKDMGMDKFSMNMLMPQGAALDKLNDILVTYTEIGPVITQLQEYSRIKGLEFMWYSPTPICIFNPVIHGLGNKGCAACDGLLSIAPNGDILPCSSFPRPMGNILTMQGSFKQAWQGEKFVYFQEKRFAHKKCRECSYLAVCNGGCPLYWQEVGYEELINNNQLAIV